MKSIFVMEKVTKERSSYTTASLKMSLESLPEELLLLVIRQLDTVTLVNLYLSGSETINNILRLPGVVKHFDFSMNTLATVQTLKQNFCKDLSYNLQELNMCGVPNLTKTALLSALPKMKNLKSLDVSYTNVHMIDLLDIHQICPTLKNVAIEFYVPDKMSSQLIIRLRDMFQKMEKVHFIGSLTDLLLSTLPLQILNQKHFDVIKYTIIKLDKTWRLPSVEEGCQPLQFNSFCIYFLNWVFPSLFINNPFKSFRFDFEFKPALVLIIYNVHQTRRVICSDIFKQFFEDRFGIDAEPESKFETEILGHFGAEYTNLVLMIWNLETTTFDDSFYRKLFTKVNEFFPRNENEAYSEDRNWFHIKKIEGVPGPDLSMPPPHLLKRKRLARDNIILNFDDKLKEYKYVQLSFDFNECEIYNPIALATSSDYLKKLTYLSLTGFAYYTQGFFNVLFRSCDHLVTLNVEAPPVTPCTPLIQRSIPLTRSLKNLRIVDKVIDFRSLFPALSQCKTLENIHIHDLCIVTGGFASPETIFQNCRNLYYMALRLSLAETALKKVNSIINKAKAKCGRSYLRFELYNNLTYKDVRYNYDPFLGVFKLNPIKEL